MENGERAKAGFQGYRITLPIGHDVAGTFDHRHSRKVIVDRHFRIDHQIGEAPKVITLATQ